MKTATPRLTAAAVLALAALTTGLVQLSAAEPAATKSSPSAVNRPVESSLPDGGSARDADDAKATGAKADNSSVAQDVAAATDVLIAEAAAADAADPRADRATYIRRLSLDLTGLPPSDEEVRAFVKDDSPDAKAKLVDRLLESDAYKQRWRRHTLTLTRPATTQPFTIANAQVLEAKKDLEIVLTRQLQNAERQTRELQAARALEVYALAAAVADKQVKAAYLGVGVETPNDTVRAQLKLPEGAGLVVNYVDPEGPSRDHIRPHDVLQKLDDQVLVNAQQLVTLVRMHKPGESVQVTVLREARPLTLTIKLAPKDLPPLREYLPQSTAEPAGNAARLATLAAACPQYTSLSARDAGTLAFTPAGDLVGRATVTGPIRIDDGDQVITFVQDVGKNYVAVHDRGTGRIKTRWVVAGDDPQEWKIVPEPVLRKLNVLHGTIDVFPTIEANGVLNLKTATTQPAQRR